MNKAVTDAAGKCARCGRSHASAEKLRATIRRLREQLRTHDRPRDRPRENLRRQAYEEATETGEPVAAILKRWECE
jgi:hypothetical protein